MAWDDRLHIHVDIGWTLRVTNFEYHMRISVPFTLNSHTLVQFNSSTVSYLYATIQSVLSQRHPHESQFQAQCQNFLVYHHSGFPRPMECGEQGSVHKP